MSELIKTPVRYDRGNGLYLNGSMRDADGLYIYQDESQEKLAENHIARNEYIALCINDHERLVTENVAKDAEIEREQAAFNELMALNRQLLEAGESQAKEWDRYWTAAGIGTSDITVDDAIELWQKREAEVERLKADAAKEKPSPRQWERAVSLIGRFVEDIEADHEWHGNECSACEAVQTAKAFLEEIDGR